MASEQPTLSRKDVDIIYRLNFRREVVFKAWTDPDSLSQWFAPKGCTVHFKKLDLRQGGSFHCCISNPEFGDCWSIGTYLEIRSPEKIVFTMINADENGNPIDPSSIGMDPQWPGKTTVMVTFEEDNGRTTINLKQTVSEILAKKTGAHPSWISMFDRMQSLIASA